MQDNDILPRIELLALYIALVSGAGIIGFFAERAYQKPSPFDLLLWPLPLILAYLTYLAGGAHARAMIVEGVHLRRRCIVHLHGCPVDEYFRNVGQESSGSSD